MARAEAGKATAARCSGLARPFICLAKWPERLCHRGAGGLLASPHSHPYPPPPPPNPALSPDRPHLSGQQEFPFFCLPQLHHVRQGLNRCTNQKHTHRVCVVVFFLMHGKETLFLFPYRPLCTRLTKNKSPFSFYKRRPPEKGAQARSTMDGWKPAVPVTERRPLAGPGGSPPGAGGTDPRPPRGGLLDARIPQHLGRASLSRQDGSRAARLGKQSCRKPGRGGALARAAQSGGCARGAWGPRAQRLRGARARAASGPHGPPKAPRRPSFLCAWGRGAREGTRRG